MLSGCVDWPPALAQRYRAEGYWDEVTLFDTLARTAARLPDKLAIVDGERRVSYAQLLRQVEALAAGFVALGLRPLDRVVFQLNNSLEVVTAFYALARIGVIPIMSLPAHRRSEIAHFARASGAVALLIPDQVRNFDYREMARQVVGECPLLRFVVVSGQAGEGQIALTALAEPGADAAAKLAGVPQPDAEEVALMLLSGGTTGLPKLIPRTHTDYYCGSRHSAQCSGYSERTVLLAVLPMAHNYTLGAPGIVSIVALGGTLVVAAGTAAELVFPLIESERVTVVNAAVPLVAKWLAADLFDRYDLSSLQVFVNGGAKLVTEMRMRVEEKFRCTYQESFGTAEGLLNVTRLDDTQAVRMHGSGRPVCAADEIAIVDAEGRRLPDGEVGELVVRGPYTICGYYNAPEINKTAFTADGFYRMGDAVKRVDGCFYLEGRIKDLINRGGEKISSEEVENHILAHPKVESACVVAMPDPVFGEKACAFVILRPGCTLNLEELVTFLQARDIARFKMPERLEVVEEFPISPAGKILRRDLRTAIAAKMAPAGGR